MSGFSLRKPSPRTLVVVDLRTRAIFATRNEDMNRDGMAAARITKPIYDLVKSGNGIMFYAHTPHLLRKAIEINGRFFAKPHDWIPKAPKIPEVTPQVTPEVTPQVRKFYNPTGYNDGTVYVEYDGKTFTAIDLHGQRHPNICWSIDEVEWWVREQRLKELTVSKVRKFINPFWTTFNDGTERVELEDGTFYCVRNNERKPCGWNIEYLNSWLMEGSIKEIY
jgi:hypothetical protein